MKNVRSSVRAVLLLVLIASLIPGLTAFASAGRSSDVACEFNAPSINTSSSSAVILVDGCCDVSTSALNSSAAVPVDGCCEVKNLFGAGTQNATLASYTTRPVVSDGCCDEVLPLGPSSHSTTLAAFAQVDDGCGAPVDGSCGITLPSDSVVGDMPADEQAYWAPGKITTNVVINAGTYWVTGVGTADNGDKFYRILVACQYLWVPVDSMQPSYQTPWSGQPLPTTAVT